MVNRGMGVEVNVSTRPVISQLVLPIAFSASLSTLPHAFPRPLVCAPRRTSSQQRHDLITADNGGSSANSHLHYPQESAVLFHPSHRLCVFATLQ